jgi:FixJ family two-component response regulator
MSQADQIVYIVDDEPACREAVVSLLNAWDFEVVAFASAHEFVAAPKADCASCLVLDIGLPGVTGLDLQKQLAGVPHPPIIFLTGRGDIPKAVQAMRAGAVEFLTKPFVEEELISAIQDALKRDRVERAMHADLADLRSRLALLTPREHEVLPLVIGGMLNKQAASELGISEVTLQAHRSRILKKMRAHSVAELVRMASRLDVPVHGRSEKDSHA